MQASDVKWGILAPGNIAKAFALGVQQANAGKIVALGSRSADRAKAFADEMKLGDVTIHTGYDALLADGNVDAVYIANPHPMHAKWAVRAARAGKHIFVEKPAGMNHAEVMAMVEAAREHDVFFMEAFKDRCFPQTDKVCELIERGVIGGVRFITCSFGYGGGDTINPDSRNFAAELGGGGILDVGCYPMQWVRRVVGASMGKAFENPQQVKAVGQLGETGVDEWTAATLKFENGVVAEVSTAVRATLDNRAVIVGSAGRIVVPDPWLNDRTHPQDGKIEVSAQGKTETIDCPSAFTAFGYEALHAAECIAQGLKESPRMSWDDSLGQLAALDAWRHEIKLQYPCETPEGFRVPVSGDPLQRLDDAPMTYGRVAGCDKDISKLVMGCDNQTTFPHAAVMFDDFWQRGGNAFDTAHLYFGGTMERLLGQWIKSRGVRDQAAIICKGCHTPWNTPEFMPKQLAESLDRLQTDRAEVYLLHRDNADVPAGEFIDVMHEQAEKGLIGAFGGSNWSMQRVAEANDYAEKNGKRKMTVVSNNFSLARMVRPVWSGCIAASDPESVAFLTERGLANFAWSSQARGYFLSHAATGQAGPWDAEAPFDDDDNRQRRERAFELADAKGVTAINIAAAYVLAQPFPSFALIGPRKVHETATSMPALGVELSDAELAYLDLRAGSPTG